MILHVDKQDWNGYYLGKGMYSVKYSPKAPATLYYTIRSDINEIDGNKGVFVVENTWPGEPTQDSFEIGQNWFTDKTEISLFDGIWQGSKTVSKWREEALSDWGKRWELLK